MRDDRDRTHLKQQKKLTSSRRRSPTKVWNQSLK